MLETSGSVDFNAEVSQRNTWRARDSVHPATPVPVSSLRRHESEMAAEAPKNRWLAKHFYPHQPTPQGSPPTSGGAMQRDGNDSCGMRAREVDEQNGGSHAQRARRSSAGSDCPSCSTDRSEQDGPSLTTTLNMLSHAGAPVVVMMNTVQFRKRVTQFSWRVRMFLLGEFQCLFTASS